LVKGWRTDTIHKEYSSIAYNESTGVFSATESGLYQVRTVNYLVLVHRIHCSKALIKFIKDHIRLVYYTRPLYKLFVFMHKFYS
jgi:hypothetical protein